MHKQLLNNKTLFIIFFIAIVLKHMYVQIAWMVSLPERKWSHGRDYQSSSNTQKYVTNAKMNAVRYKMQGIRYGVLDMKRN